jgi:hypothetical protein
LAEPSELRSDVFLNAELERRGNEMSLSATRAMLRSHPSFVAVHGQGFQLGRCLGSNSVG